MKSALLQCLAIAALAAVAGGVYNTVNPNREKRLPWLAKQYQGMEYLPEEKAPAPPTSPVKQEEGKKTGPGTGTGTEKEPGTGATAKEQPPQALEGVPLIDLKATLEEFNAGTTLFIDARKPEDYEAGHIPGARSMFAHAGDLTDRIAQLLNEHPAEAPVVIYCTNSKECEDSKLVANQLKQVGFVNLKIFQGGFPEWKEKQQPIVTGKEPGTKGGEP